MLSTILRPSIVSICMQVWYIYIYIYIYLGPLYIISVIIHFGDNRCCGNVKEKFETDSFETDSSANGTWSIERTKTPSHLFDRKTFASLMHQSMVIFSFISKKKWRTRVVTVSSVTRETRVSEQRDLHACPQSSRYKAHFDANIPWQYSTLVNNIHVTNLSFQFIEWQWPTIRIIIRLTHCKCYLRGAKRRKQRGMKRRR